MSNENPLKGLETDEENNPYSILVSLLGKNDIEMKTEIKHPAKMAAAFVIASDLKNQGFGETAKMITDYLTKIMEYYVSKDRKSRSEIVEGLKAVANDNKDELDRLTEDHSI